MRLRSSWNEPDKLRNQIGFQIGGCEFGGHRYLVAEAKLVPHHRRRVIHTVYGHTAGFATDPAAGAYVSAAVFAALEERKT